MKEIKLSFPYPSTSRHNLSQDVGTSLSLGLVIPVRVVEVLGGDSHRIGTSFSLISNPLVKPLLQGVNMRVARFWVPRRIYHLDQRANNSDFDLMEAPVRHSFFSSLRFPALGGSPQLTQCSNFEQGSLFDYLGLASVESNLFATQVPQDVPSSPVYMSKDNTASSYHVRYFNAEPYIGYLDICRNYYADSANGMIAFAWAAARTGFLNDPLRVCVTPLQHLDAYIDGIQNSSSQIAPFDASRSGYSSQPDLFKPFILSSSSESVSTPGSVSSTSFDEWFQISRFGLCVPLNRPDRLSRLFDTKPLTSQNATVTPSEITISNLSFLSKMQRYLTRRFFGGSRFTDVMYSVLGQKVPHVDSPVLLDVFDYEIGSELVASTNASETQNPGVLGGFFSAAGRLTTSRGGYKRKYRFNEPGYLMDLVYIMPRLFRTSFVPDFYMLSGGAGSLVSVPMLQSNFIPDFNGIGWQQPVQMGLYVAFTFPQDTSQTPISSRFSGVFSEPSWQQYRTLPDVCSGAMNPLRLTPGTSIYVGFGPLSGTNTVNSPLFTFNDRMKPFNVHSGYAPTSDGTISTSMLEQSLLARYQYTDFNALNSVFGTENLVQDNIFVVFRYSHQAKRQVTKRFTLTFA